MSLLTSAVAAVITDPAGRVLLCQQSHGHRLWTLPGGRIRTGESPIHATIRDIFEEIGSETEIIDLLGLYQLTGDGCGESLPDVLLHVFRGRLGSAEVLVNAPGRISRLSWHDPAAPPQSMTATTRVALADAAAGRSGVLRTVERDTEPEVPDAVEVSAPAQAGFAAVPA